MKQFLFILSLLLISSCSSDSVLLKEALRLAGDNKSELERVLKYYSANVEDSFKYKAAVFLIENNQKDEMYWQVVEKYNKS